MNIKCFMSFSLASANFARLSAVCLYGIRNRHKPYLVCASVEAAAILFIVICICRPAVADIYFLQCWRRGGRPDENYGRNKISDSFPSYGVHAAGIDIRKPTALFPCGIPLKDGKFLTDS